MLWQHFERIWLHKKYGQIYGKPDFNKVDCNWARPDALKKNGFWDWVG